MAGAESEPDGRWGWRMLLVGFQWLGVLHLPIVAPPPPAPDGHPERVVPLSALPRRERERWARFEEQVR